MAIGNIQNIDIFVAIDIEPVTPSDTVDLPSHARAIRATNGGTLRIKTYRGSVRDTRISSGEVLMVYASRIYATGTSATGLEALV